MPDSFITVDELSDYLGRSVSADPAAQLAVDGACAVIRTISEQDFTESTETVTLDGTGTDALVLSQLPISSVQSVTVAGTADTNYALSGTGVLVKTSGVWPRGRQNVTVKYRHGYRSTDIPADIRQVALGLAARQLVQGPKNAMAETNGDVQIRYATAASDLTNNELRILRRHRGR